jgi:chromate reductase
MLVPHAGSMFDQDGNLTDEATRKRLRDFIAGFAEFIEI